MPRQTHQSQESLYQTRVDCLSYEANSLAVSIMLLSQFIFFSLHYAIGSTLTVCAMLSWGAQFCINCVEWRKLKNRDMVGLKRVLDVHFWLNRAFQLLYIPFLIWTVVLMYERFTSAP